ncbi:MAG: hypothetical protein M3082_20835, partial [Candidatus Dormibacteraeota bacterium]|nr:hypothetical protein [Candidatus Dormibacteraeota bacterium]
MWCLHSPYGLYVVVGLPQCVTFAAFDSFAGTPTRRLALIPRGGWFESIAPAKEANLPGTVGALCNL